MHVRGQREQSVSFPRDNTGPGELVGGKGAGPRGSLDRLWIACVHARVRPTRSANVEIKGDTFRYQTGFTFFWSCELRGQMISLDVPAYRRSVSLAH